MSQDELRIQTLGLCVAQGLRGVLTTVHHATDNQIRTR